MRTPEHVRRAEDCPPYLRSDFDEMERGRPRPQKYAPVNATISKLAEHRYCCTPRKTSEQFCSPVGAAAKMAAPNLPKGAGSR